MVAGRIDPTVEDARFEDTNQSASTYAGKAIDASVGLSIRTNLRKMSSMNWDAAGAIGEIIGATAVVVSVIYLAVQIRGQTEQAKLAATRELMSNFTNRWTELLMTR